MSDYLKAAEKHALDAAHYKGKRDRERSALLATMYAALHSAAVQDEMGAIQRKIQADRENETPVVAIHAEYRFYYENDPVPLVTWGDEATDLLHDIEEGKNPLIVKVECRHYASWSQVYPAANG